MKLEINKTYEIGDKRFRLNEDLELIEITKSIYEFKEGNPFWFIKYDYVCFDMWEDSEDDKGLLEIGNAFLTEEEAKFELKCRKIIAKIKRWKCENDGNYKFVVEDYNYNIEYDYDDKDFFVERKSIFRNNPNYLYFSSEEKARECLSFIGKENWKKYVLEIE